MKIYFIKHTDTDLLYQKKAQVVNIVIYNKDNTRNAFLIIPWLYNQLLAHSYRLGLVTWGYQVLIPVGPDICHRGCAYTVLQTVQRNGVYSAAYGTVHYKEPLKSFEIKVGHNPGFGLLSVAILPWLWRKRRKSNIHNQLYCLNTAWVLKRFNSDAI